MELELGLGLRLGLGPLCGVSPRLEVLMDATGVVGGDWGVCGPEAAGEVTLLRPLRPAEPRDHVPGVGLSGGDLGVGEGPSAEL